VLFLRLGRLKKRKGRNNPHLVEGLEDDPGELVGGARGSGDRGRVVVAAARGGRAARPDDAGNDGGGRAGGRRRG
jgi:hypothetical protein